MTQSAAIITGGAHRMGKAMALTLAKLGYHIVLHYGTSETGALEVQKKVRKEGVRCQVLSMDLAQSDTGPQLFDQLDPEFRVDLLINNASIFIPSDFDDESEEMLDMHYRINFRSPYSLIKTYFNRFSSGHVINMLDTKVTRNETDHLDYLLTKKSLKDLTYLAAMAGSPRFRVNGIAPGLILPPEGKDQDYLNEKATEVPLKTTGDLLQIQNALHYLIKNPFLTGQIIYVDGGEHLQ